jgi:predicted permease
MYRIIDILEKKEGGEQTSWNPQTFLESTISEFPNKLPILPELNDHTHGPSNPQGDYPNVQPYPSVEDNETSPLLNKKKAKAVTMGIWARMKFVFEKINTVMNPPMWGGILAIIVGLIPFLRKSLFDDSGALSAFEQSVENLGDLYTSLQTVVLGSQLRSKAGKRPPIGTLSYLFFYRFIITTAVACGLVYGARKWLGDYIKNDPILVRLIFKIP